MELKGRIALVTGGAVRIGRALSLALARAGCHVFIHYGRSEGPARETAAEARALGVEAAVHCADLADAEAVAGVLPAALERFGRVEVLVNNAAIFPDEDTSAATGALLFDRLVAVNLRAPFLLSQAFAAALPEGVEGRILNLLDARVRRASGDHFVYRLTKSALWTMTESLAVELAPRVTVNGIAPGAILPPPGRDRRYLERLAREEIPLERPGSPEAVTAAALHLLRQDFTTGVVLPLDGGQFL